MTNPHTHALPGSIPQSHCFKHTSRPLNAHEKLPAIPTLIEQIVAACKASRLPASATAAEVEDDETAWLAD